MIQTFRIVGESHANLLIKSYAVETPALLNHNNANPLEMGEWLTINANNRVARAANPGVPPGPFPLYAEKGRSDTQGISGRGKVPIIMAGSYIGESIIINVAVAPALGARLEVADVTYLTLTKSGLQTHAGGANPVVGHVLRTAASNGGWLQFLALVE